MVNVNTSLYGILIYHSIANLQEKFNKGWLSISKLLERLLKETETAKCGVNEFIF